MSPLAALVVLLSLLCPLHLCGAAVYYVRPTQPRNATCPSDPCLTLDEYAVSSEKYFASNTTFLFLDGDHELSFSFNVSGIHNLTLKPYTDGSSVFVHPDPYNYVPLKMRFKVVSDVTVADLTFKSISFVFENSSSVTLTGLAISADPEFRMYAGSAITSIGNSTITLQGEVLFLGNSSQNCGISVHDCGVVISEGNVTFSGWRSGAISGGGNSTLILNTTVTFTDNHNNDTGFGGAIILNGSSVTVLTGNVSFTRNKVLQDSVTGNSAQGGGAIGLHGNSQMILNGTVTFTGNYVRLGGGAVFVYGNSQLVLNGTVTFTGNSAILGGAIASSGDSSLILQGNITFIKNVAIWGGAIALLGSRTIQIPGTDYTLVTFEKNRALNGGALYFSQQYMPNITPSPHCAFFFEHLPINHVFNFIDNVADDGGDAIYGAYFERECITPSGIMYTPDYILSIINNISLFSPSFHDDPSLFSSDPIEICLCEDGRYNCSIQHSFSRSVYPGELFDISAVVVGDMHGLVNSTVIVLFDISQCTCEQCHVELGDLQNSQRFQSRRCAKFTYSFSVNISNSFECYLLLYPNSVSISDNILVSVSLLACPVGFALNSMEQLCDCTQLLLHTETVSCNISARSIQRQGTVWIGALLQNTSNTSVIYSNTCPFSYCSIDRLSITVNQTHLDQDVQCNDNRAGILCGGCRANYSLALGSNRCLPGCTNNRLSLVIAFAAAGIALVFFIKILNLTVSHGTLNGLIFYANIIGAQPTLVLPTRGSPASRAVSTFLSVFIAWLNLDLGIETCFFNDMDAYAKAWLQFIFPIYVWIISLFVILISKWSTCASRFFGNNSVPVLATLILLSYTKLLRAVISPLSVSHIQYLNGTRIPVWERDGNLQYFAGKHIPLMVLALTFLIVLIIPFTFVITSIQWLNRGTHYRVLCWVTNLKPFFDAFTGPLKDEHRYWVGVLLLARCVILLIVFVYTSNGNDTASVSVTFAALVILTIAGSKYRNKVLALLEQSYILNLGLFVSGTLYVRYASIDGNQEALFITSVGIAFLQFVATVIYHSWVQLRNPLNKIKLRVKRIRMVLKEDSEPVCSDSFEEQEQVALVQEVHLPQGYSNCHFRESLLAYVNED